VNGNFSRPGQHNKNNQRNRNRSRRNIGGSGGGGGGPSNKVFDSNGPDIKLRGTTQTIAEKYMQLGRDAQSSGDGVAAENYYQHAEHYYRLWAASQPVGQSLQMSRKLGEEEFDDESDDGSEDEGEGNPVEPVASESGEPTEMAAGELGDGQQQRPFRANNYRDNSNNRDNTNRQRGRWQNRRNERGFDANREGAVAPDTGVGEPAPELVAAPVEAAPAIAPVMPEAGGQWEAPSFLQRPFVAAIADAPPVVEDAPAPRRPRVRRTRAEIDAEAAATATAASGEGPTE
jgi:curved DNA-binding protein CbpA